jgi:threonine/homoserine/homoserine lactone efflux protein
MFDTATLIAYLTASIAIILAPGPAQALVLTHSIGEGRRSGVMTAIGLNIGTLFHAVAAALGLSAILATSAVAFAIVKYLGAAYLIYLGVKALREQAFDPHTSGAAAASASQAFLRAVVTGILNPKVALFFLAFLPQFVDPSRGSAIVQFLILGSILALLDTLYEIVLATLAGAIAGWFTHNPRFAVWRQRITGAALVALGVRLALAERE